MGVASEQPAEEPVTWWGELLRSARGRMLVGAVVVVVVVFGIAAGVVATSSGTPAVPVLYMSGIGEHPCAPGQAYPLAAATSEQFLPDSSVLSGDRGNSCTPAAVAASTRWLNDGTVPGTAAQRDLAARALLDLRLSVQADGAVVAGFYPGWAYTWPRDSSFVIAALAATGHSAQAFSALRFLQRMQNPDGTWAARYHPDGSGPVTDGRPAELDAVGWVPWAVWAWASARPAPPRAELIQLWPMVTAAARAAMASITSDGLPSAAMDYWEDKPIEQTLGTAAPLLAGLRAAAGLAQMRGDTTDQTRWGTVADRLSAAIAKMFGATGYLRTPTARSGADAAVTFLGPPFGQPSAAVLAAAAKARQTLTEPNGGVRPGAAWPGARGVAFTPETAMFALFDAGTGQEAAADQVLAWLAAHRTTLGEFPEQISPNGKPISVAPLAWTDAVVLLTLLAQRHQLPVVP
ncbi:MAG TPA: glycoside hydrolase family 15 [Streptosporangiaceae bacterium]|nr:glycoside hydrolase family 15 [Streptosporangiaceae bacterium]